MKQELPPTLAALERELEAQNQSLATLTRELAELPEGVRLAVTEEWREAFEATTAVRPRPIVPQPVIFVRA